MLERAKRIEISGSFLSLTALSICTSRASSVSRHPGCIGCLNRNDPDGLSLVGRLKRWLAAEPAVELLGMDELSTTLASVGAIILRDLCAEAAQALKWWNKMNAHGREYQGLGGALAHLARFGQAVRTRPGVLKDVDVGCRKLVRTLEAVRQLSGGDGSRFTRVAEGLRLEGCGAAVHDGGAEPPFSLSQHWSGRTHSQLPGADSCEARASLRTSWEHVFGADSSLETVYDDICFCA